MNEEKIANKVGILGVVLELLMLFLDGWILIYIWNTLINNNDIIFNLNYFNGLGIIFLLILLKEKNNSLSESKESMNRNTLEFVNYVFSTVGTNIIYRFFIIISTFIVNLFI